MTNPGFDHTVLSEFRTRLLIGGAERRLLDLLVDCARDRGLLKVRGRQRTDSTHVLAAVRALNRVELVTETMRHALTVLAALAPDWLRAHGRPEWVKRYERRPEDDGVPSKQAERHARAETMGQDGASSPSMATRHHPGPWSLLGVDSELLGDRDGRALAN